VPIGIEEVIGAMAGGVCLFLIFSYFVLRGQGRTMDRSTGPSVFMAFTFLVGALLPEVPRIDGLPELVMVWLRSSGILLMPVALTFLIITYSRDIVLSEKEINRAIMAGGAVVMLGTAVLVVLPGPLLPNVALKVLQGAFVLAALVLVEVLTARRYLAMKAADRKVYTERYTVIFGIAGVSIATLPPIDLMLALSINGSLAWPTFEGLWLARNLIVLVQSFALAYFILHKRPLEEANLETAVVSSKFDAIMRYAGDGYAILDRDGRVSASNKNFARYAGRRGDDIIGIRFIDMVESENDISRALDMALGGSFVAGIECMVGRGHEEGALDPKTHAVSTFAPLKGPRGTVMGVLVLCKDLSIERELETEREKRRMAEARDSTRRLITNLLPVLLRSGGQEGRVIYTKMVLDSFEEAMGLRTKEAVDLDLLPEYLCLTLNGLGGDFHWKMKDEGAGIKPERPVIKFVGRRCPWGEEDSRRNPFMCQLCLGVFTRAFKNMDAQSQVDLLGTLGNGDKECLVLVNHAG